MSVNAHSVEPSNMAITRGTLFAIEVGPLDASRTAACGERSLAHRTRTKLKGHAALVACPSSSVSTNRCFALYRVRLLSLP
jgi:hypothetical protein